MCIKAKDINEVTSRSRAEALKWQKEYIEKKFNVAEVTDKLISWIREWFDKNGKGCNAVIGISGGKDSSIVAALIVKALGKDRVIGVMMPQGVQPDISDSELLISTLEIKSVTVNIGKAVDEVILAIPDDIELTKQSTQNLPPRIRMSTLYCVSQSMNGRVINTCNLSEDYVGYSTRYGDSVGDMSPLSRFTVCEVKAIGRYLGLPECLIEKVPSDGLSGLTDEDNLGFTYPVLDQYIRTGVITDPEAKKLIDRKHKANLFKLELMPVFPYDPS